MRAWLVVLVGCSSHRDSPPPVQQRPLVPETCTEARLDEATLDECEQHCRDGSAIACAVAAHKRFSGIAMRHPDVAGSLPLALRGCDLGARKACEQAALVYTGAYDGRERDGDRDDAMTRRYIELSDKNCTGGDGEACIDLVFWYDRNGLGTTPWIVPDHDRAMKYLARGLELEDQACDRGNGWACHLLAVQYAAGNAQLKVDTARSSDLSRRACELGHGDSCMLTGDERLYRHGCDLGNAASCGMLAIEVRRSEGSEAALHLLQRACDLRSASHCERVAEELRGYDDTGAAAALARACALGHEEDCAVTPAVR